MAVREIKEWSGVTQLPNQPDYMRGVLNLRGTMVPIIDLRCRFGQGLTDATPVHVVIVVHVDGKTVGLLADRVLDIVSLDATDIQPIKYPGRVYLLPQYTLTSAACIEFEERRKIKNPRRASRARRM